MVDQEKIIRGLEHCASYYMCPGCRYYDPNDTRCQIRLMREALELFESQEPRVLTLDEVLNSPDKLMWLQYKSTIAIDRYEMIPTAPLKKYIPDPFSVIFYTGHVRAKESYGKTWRCWNAMPDKERLIQWND